MTHRWDPDDALMQAYRDAKREHEANMAALRVTVPHEDVSAGRHDELLEKAELSLVVLEELRRRLRIVRPKRALVLPSAPAGVLAVDTPSTREAERQRAAYEASPQSVIDALAEFDAWMLAGGVWMLAGGVWKDQPEPEPDIWMVPAPQPDPPRSRDYLPVPARRERKRANGQLALDLTGIAIGLTLLILSAHFGWPLSFPGLIVLILALIPWKKRL